MVWFRRLFSVATLRIAIAFVAIVILGAVLFFASVLIHDPEYSVKSFELMGNNTISDNIIDAQLNGYIGKSMFLVSTNDIKNKVGGLFTNLSFITAVKIFPDKILIKMSEKDPKLVLINLNGAYLVDEDSNVMKVLAREQIGYSQDKLDIATGFADENSPVIKDALLAKFKADNNITDPPTDAQQKLIDTKFNFDNISLSDKKKMYDSVLIQIKNEIDSLTGKVQHTVATGDFAYLPQVTLINNVNYSVNDTIDKPRLDLTLELLRFFSDPQKGPIIVGNIQWEGEMLVRINLSDGTSVIFGALKKASFQLEDYDVITSYLKANQKRYTQIDLSSNKISVK